MRIFILFPVYHKITNRARIAQLARNEISSQKKRSEGKPYRVALVATMPVRLPALGMAFGGNKLTHVIHSVWTNNQPFVDYTMSKAKEAV